MRLSTVFVTLARFSTCRWTSDREVDTLRTQCLRQWEVILSCSLHSRRFRCNFFTWKSEHYFMSPFSGTGSLLAAVRALLEKSWGLVHRVTTAMRVGWWVAGTPGVFCRPNLVHACAGMDRHFLETHRGMTALVAEAPLLRQGGTASGSTEPEDSHQEREGRGVRDALHG